MKQASNKGFTMVELLIVIAIIGILVAIILPNFTTSRIDSKNKAMRVAMRETQLALELYRAQYNAYPATLALLVPDFIAEIPDATKSANSLCSIVYYEDDGYKLTADRCIGGASTAAEGVQTTDEFARCPDYCGACTANSYTQGDPEFYESIAVYGGNEQCY